MTLTDGVRIEPHPKLAIAEARAASLPTATRAIGPSPRCPGCSTMTRAVVQPFEFAATRAIGGGLNVLELSGVNDPALVTPDDPLRVVIPHPLGPGEHVLPVAFDGEFYLPLGRAESVGGRPR